MGVSLGTVDRLMRAGVLEYERDGGRVRVLRSSIDKYLDQTWDDYWSTVERIAADGPLPDGARAVRLSRLFSGGEKRKPTQRAPLIRVRGDAA